jgi:iron complex transport system ATP-binding protein
MTSQPVVEPTMSLQQVTFEVADTILLHPLSLDLPATGVTGLVGQNGSGKSTLMRILARQQRASSGEILFDDRPLHHWREREFARRVAYLPQHTPLAAGLRARELVELGRYPWHGALGRFGPADRHQVEEAMTLTGIETLAERMVDSLSGGERQRVWLAMLIAQDARLLLLDEPISALDPAHQVGVLKLVRRISHTGRAAVVIVLHDINLAARFCDHVIALKGGRLIAHGRPAEFMTAARLTEVYDVDMGVFPNPDSAGMIAYVRE